MRLLAHSALAACAAAGIASTASTALAQSATIRGTVTDETGTPVPGVQVSLVGTPLGSLTDDAGRYRITGAPSGAVQVRAARIGYAPATLDVTAATSTSRCRRTGSPSPA
jgi:protocatechuate 3,4-dioxygenase beta subunit